MGKTVIPVALPEGIRLVVSARAASGGSCRSALASRLAGELINAGTSVALDTDRQPTSAWPAFLFGRAHHLRLTEKRSLRQILDQPIAEQDGEQGNRKRGDGQTLVDGAPEHLAAEGRSR
ncbi:hypothetical protein [Streptomyces sp. NPDC059209]|uniref:hypothetical protein n=1 Tax=Streptomyces sp. NPDC059209 TaxID=3346769 RepID=UPI00369CB4BD